MQMATSLAFMFRRPQTISEWETYIAVLETHKSQYEQMMRKENADCYEAEEMLQEADQSNRAEVKKHQDHVQLHVQNLNGLKTVYELLVCDLAKAKVNLDKLKTQGESQGK